MIKIVIIFITYYIYYNIFITYLKHMISLDLDTMPFKSSHVINSSCSKISTDR